MKETTSQLSARAVDAIEAADILLTNDKVDFAVGRATTPPSQFSGDGGEIVLIWCDYCTTTLSL